ncbi:MAG: radical SAM protein [Candidatus Hydrogenedentes bacterium]|nr:radical SAM protein [Candidatus Hydrogenedentota bacterium]
MNPVTAQSTLRIIETYASIQGESTWAGLPCAFIRLARCNLRCRWCDTTYSFHGGEKVTIGALLEQVKAFGLPLVEVTGGEPLAQAGCVNLCDALVEAGYTVLVETSGSLPINTLRPEVIRIMDLKCPDSGECEKNHWPNLEYLSASRDEVKFVIASRRDYEWSRDCVRTHRLTERCKAVLFSPVFLEATPKNIVDWMLEDGLTDVRFQLQLHKFIWPPDRKGV